MAHDELRAIFTNVSDWLKFAEAKNAALFAVNVAFGAGILQAWPEIPVLKWFASSALLFLASSAVVNLISFAPAVTIPFWIRRSRDHEKLNLLFFGDIAKFAPRDYLAAVRERYPACAVPDDRFAIDFAEQIVVNARIALRKFSLFNLALYLLAAAIGTPVLALLLLAVRRARGAAG